MFSLSSWHIGRLVFASLVRHAIRSHHFARRRHRNTRHCSRALSDIDGRRHLVRPVLLQQWGE
jgi:hypothetical protein